MSKIKKKKNEPSQSTVDLSGIDFDKWRSTLSPEECKKLERIVRPHTKMMSLRFVPQDVDSWYAVAKKKSMTITAWVEGHLNAARDIDLAEMEICATEVEGGGGNGEE